MLIKVNFLKCWVKNKINVKRNEKIKAPKIGH